MLTFSQNLKELCDDRNINLKQLAKQLNMQDSLLYKYANKDVLPTIKNAVKLADFFNCSLNYLLGLDDLSSSTKTGYDKKSFFSRYEKLLDENNMKHYFLSKEIGLSQSSYLSWKKGCLPYLDTLIKIAKYFDVSIDYLIGRSDKQ